MGVTLVHQMTRCTTADRTGATNREHVLDEYEQVLDGLVLADVTEQVEERLGALVAVLAQNGVPLLRVADGVVVGQDEVVVLLADHLRPGDGSVGLRKRGVGLRGRQGRAQGTAVSGSGDGGVGLRKRGVGLRGRQGRAQGTAGSGSGDGRVGLRGRGVGLRGRQGRAQGTAGSGSGDGGVGLRKRGVGLRGRRCRAQGTAVSGSGNGRVGLRGRRCRAQGTAVSGSGNEESG